MNSGRVLAAPMMLNMARNMLQPVRGPRRSKAGLDRNNYELKQNYLTWLGSLYVDMKLVGT